MDAREFTNGMHLIPLDQNKEPTCGRGFLDEANYGTKEKGHRLPMEEDHLRQGRDEKGVYWEIDRDGCFEWLKDNGYTGETELAPAVVWCSY